MTDAAKMREVCERNVRLLSQKPDKGHLTGITKARIEDGVRCLIEEGPWRLAADMPVKAGGDETAPTPGMLGRGALASCLAIDIRLWAARLEIPVDSIEVEVQADFNARGQLGVGDAPSGYQEVRYIVSIESPASHQTLTELLDTAESHSTYFDVFSRPQPMKRLLHLNGVEV